MLEVVASRALGAFGAYVDPSLTPTPSLLRHSLPSLTPLPFLLCPSPLLSHTFPALSYTTRFLSYAPLLLLTLLSYSLAAQALLVHLFKWVEEYRQGKIVRLHRDLHMARCSKVPENVHAAACVV